MTKQAKRWRILWWYPGGQMNVEIEKTASDAKSFARSIERYGGTAHIYQEKMTRFGWSTY